MQLLNKQVQSNKDRLELVQPINFMNQTSCTSFFGGKKNSVSSVRHRASPDKLESVSSEMFATARIGNNSLARNAPLIKVSNNSKDPLRGRIRVTEATLPAIRSLF